jgi:hypothetical protein
VAQSEKVHANNGDRALFSARCEMERSDDESAYGRERPRLRLPRACRRTGRSRPSAAMRGTGRGSKSISTGISNGSEMDRDLRLQRTVHEVLCMQLDIRETNTMTKSPSRLAAKPGLQQDRPLCSTVSRTAIPRIPQRLRGGWTMAKRYQHRIRCACRHLFRPDLQHL